MLTRFEWDEWHELRTEAVKSRGQWVALCNENGEPMYELPSVTAMSWPEGRGVAESVTLTVNVRTPSGRVHPIVDELVADSLGDVNEVGELVPLTGPARFVVLERDFSLQRVDWDERRAIRVTHVAVVGDHAAPYALKIHGIDLLGTLDMLPCPSLPTTWQGDNFTRFDRDWVGDEATGELFDQPRDLAPIEMLTVADGGTITGPADEVIEQILQQSLAAIYRVTGVEKHPYFYRVIGPRGTSPRIMLRPTDQTIWQEIGEAALTSGITLGARLWWPHSDSFIPGQGINSPHHAQIIFTMEVS